jgi:DNA polymerase-3 subunit delta
MHATAFLSSLAKWTPVPVVVLHGGEAQLKADVVRVICRETLGGDEDAGLGLSRHEGRDADLKTVRDELLTVSMFAPRRVVIIDDADDFVSRHRAGLEDYVEAPAKQSVLILDVKFWPKNTRLAKRLPDRGVDFDCSELAGAKLNEWLIGQMQARFGKQLSRDAAVLMAELAGTGLSLLAQEVEKVAAYAGDRPKAGVEDVRAVVGGWRAETTWAMIDSIRDGRPAEALAALDRLLTAGEAPQKLLGGINFVFRKFAEATERSRLGTPLRPALQQSAVFPRDAEAVERYLRRIGRARAADHGLKGGSRVPDRLQIEQLVLSLAGVTPLEA